MANFDVISVGACGLDIILGLDRKNRSISFDQSSGRLTIQNGNKILLDDYKFSCGGNAANVAAGMSDLGLKSTVFAEIGSDDFAKKIAMSLKKKNVDTSHLKIEKGDSGFSVILSFGVERTILAEAIKRNHDFSFNDVSASFLYLTSLPRNWINAYMETLRFINEKNIAYAFNPGTAQIEDKDKIIFEVIKKSKILFLNKEEAEKLLSKKRSFTQLNEKKYFRSLLSELKELGTEIGVITDGANGSYCIDQRGKCYFINSLSTSVIEMTGAGDAYASAFCYATIKGKTVEEAMVLGSINSSSVIQEIGAQEGLLSSDILEEKAGRLNNFRPVSI